VFHKDKRLVLRLALAGALLPAFGNAQAQSAQPAYPSKPIKFVVPVPAGGAADVMARMIATHLQATWGQPVVVDNKPGAGSSVGMAVVAKAAPDGYTIGMGNVAANAINPAVRPKAFPYDPVKDFTAVTMVGITPLILVVNPKKVSARTVPEFIAHLKAHPGQLSYGSSGAGSALHVGMELFLHSSGTSMVHVGYKGSAPMLTDLLGGQIDAAMDAAATSWPQVQSGKLRALGVSTAQRVFFAPDVPPIAQSVRGFEMNPWHGVMAPAGTPRVVIDKLATEIQAFLRLPDTEAKLRERGVVRVGSSVAEFAKTLSDEVAFYKKLVADTGIEAEE
jgi:tripartite-type tricarboxylate transporter receptor subunit TctC